MKLNTLIDRLLKFFNMENNENDEPKEGATLGNENDSDPISETPENPGTETQNDNKDPDPSAYGGNDIEPVEKTDPEILPEIPEPEKTPIIEPIKQIETMKDEKTQTPETTEKTPKKEKDKTPAKKDTDQTLIIVGVVLVVLIIAAFAYWNYTKKKQGGNNDGNNGGEPKEPENGPINGNYQSAGMSAEQIESKYFQPVKAGINDTE